MSIITCLIIFSGSSARSIMSFRLARINVLTLSKSPMTFLLSNGRKRLLPDAEQETPYKNLPQSLMQKKTQANASVRRANAEGRAGRQGWTPPTALPDRPLLQESAERQTQSPRSRRSITPGVRLSTSWRSPNLHRASRQARWPAGTEANVTVYALEAGAAGFSGFGALSPIKRTLLSRSDTCMPESASKSAGTCAAIFVMSPVSL